MVGETEKTYLGGLAFTAPESLGFLSGTTLYAALSMVCLEQSRYDQFVRRCDCPDSARGPFFGRCVGLSIQRRQWRYASHQRGRIPAGPQPLRVSVLPGDGKTEVCDRFDYLTGSDGTLGVNVGTPFGDKQPS